MLKSKTTWAGLGTIFSAIGYAVFTKDLASAITGIVTGLGLIASADQTS